MQVRTCPNCGATWHSADTATDWTCAKCGAIIPAPKLCKLKHMFVCQPEECGRAEECGEKKYVVKEVSE
jgi:tRNA(Ile2) C34 agmatinyltransferase TiaS